ncbi:DUF6173 family protein [Falsihalocynthiibacter arcticus]|uniref:Uncharacterized protein n=1 Tax=Falsihalocynthiibacter arcticus TaxID=1579316 RepID=A0A126UYU5_9RHOB|nr:DUF6173 family protein [Falsihalocynthiibacter arcticus]AML51214.1 hypothetical protein RC74_08065 [Falsihalocynthiibacter arcticus]
MDEEIKTTAEAVEADALPRAHVVHCGPNPPETIEQKPVPKGVSKTPMGQKTPAHWAYERLIMYIKNFEEQLDNEHEVAMGFVGGDAGVLRIEGLGYYDPDIITFYGTETSGAKTQLIQHVSQLSVMLRALPKLKAAAAPNRIGFRLAADLEEGAK